ncbi:pteridine reductase [Shewanella schlegeliana]|uniref:Pteridine reductase n=1 Tax=Shewanella schlegeliana TaxID=190308 RepID=A0ABS1SZP6_9GAMM|nr:pteridine reductase [Shewanella schlegeliana]MBL4914010.1 pteridine reductase [Shewanella schlegeliana]MCL1108606.1 pteridine reductase [Shewanella schlegeliana]GIU35649.1 pteridine reductase [Shewanella schlegeliana]
MTTWALVTGAAKRIGLAIAIQLHDDGYNIVIHYGQSVDEAQALCNRLNAKRADSAIMIQADLANANALNELIAQIEAQEIDLEILINNASCFYPTPIGESSFTKAQQLLATNLIAPYILAEKLRPQLALHNGCVINLLDIHGKRPLKDHGLYSISKAALEMATLSLAQELAPKIRVNGVSPGAILWPAQSNMESQQAVLGAIPLAKLGQPEDIAKLISHLVSAPYITGQVIAVDGGRSAVGFMGA